MRLDFVSRLQQLFLYCTSWRSVDTEQLNKTRALTSQLDFQRGKFLTLFNIFSQSELFALKAQIYKSGA